MILIIITGPTASGKTYLANKLHKNLDNSLVINTDSYYRDNLFIKWLSNFIDSIYDRIISIKKNELIKTIDSIKKNKKLINFCYYDFNVKKSTRLVKKIDIDNQNNILIVEGIFAHRLGLNYKNTINILCKDKKQLCYKRRLKRDLLYRNSTFEKVNKQFEKSWYLYYKYISSYLDFNQVYEVNTFDNISFQKLITKLNKKIINKKNQREKIKLFPFDFSI